MALLSSLGKYRNTGLLIIRVGLGVMMIYHGYPKLLGGPEQWEAVGSAMKYLGVTFTPAIWGFLAAVTETFGGFLLVIGLAFRPACIFLIFTMAVAATMHLNDGDGLMIASHAIELGIVFTGLAFIGPGRYSVDKKYVHFYYINRNPVYKPKSSPEIGGASFILSNFITRILS